MPRLTCAQQRRVGIPDPTKTQTTNTAGKPLGCTLAAYSTFAVGQISCLIRNLQARHTLIQSASMMQDGQEGLNGEEQSCGAEAQTDQPECPPSGEHGNSAHGNGDLTEGNAARQHLVRA